MGNLVKMRTTSSSARADSALNEAQRKRIKHAKWTGMIPLPSLVIALGWGYAINWDAQGAILALPFVVAFLVGSIAAIILGLSCVFAKENVEGGGLEFIYASLAINGILLIGYVAIVLLRLPILPTEVEELLKPRREITYGVPSEPLDGHALSLHPLLGWRVSLPASIATGRPEDSNRAPMDG